MTGRFVSMIFGAVYLVIGIAGFAVTGFDNFTASNTNDLLLGFELNPLHNVVHLVIGAALLLASRTAAAARSVNTAIGLTYIAVGVAGLFLVGETSNILSLNYPDNSLHLATGIVLAAAGFGVAFDDERRLVAPVSDTTEILEEPDDLLDEFEPIPEPEPVAKKTPRKSPKKAPAKKPAAKKKPAPKAAAADDETEAVPSGSDDPYAELSREDLYRRAQELGIPGRSTMDRTELAVAVRAAENN